VKLLRLVFILCLSASWARAEVTIEATADPPLPVANLLQNAGFEQGGDMPNGWEISSGMPELFTFQRQPIGGRSGACLRVAGHSSIMSGYLAQYLAIRPATRYVAGAWLRLRAGHCLIWLLSYPEGRRWDVYLHKTSWGGNPLVPDFVPLAYTDSPPPDQWIWVGDEFTSEPRQDSLNFHVGSYFERGSMDFDDAFLGLARTKLTLRVAGDVLRSVRVADDTGRECWSSGALPADTTSVRQEVPDLPTRARYCVTVTTAAGKEVQKWYPE
jgi:hypothetical protein